MANPLRGEAELAAGEKTYTLCYDINALCEAEDATGMSTDTMTRALMGSPSMTVLRGVIWAGLRRHHNDVTLFEAGDIVQAAGAKVASEAMTKALAAAFPGPTKEKAQNPRKAAAGAT